MSRTSIDLDDDLIAAAMRKYGLKTKKDAVDMALRRLVGPPISKEFLLSLEGMGWEGDGVPEDPVDHAESTDRPA